MLNKAQVLAAMRETADIPYGDKDGRKRRNIYETVNGDFHLDYATYLGGRAEEVPRGVIDELEREGIIVRAYPTVPKVNCWKLSESFHSASGREKGEIR